MLRIKGMKDVPNFSWNIHTMTLSSTGGTPGTWDSETITLELIRTPTSFYLKNDTDFKCLLSFTNSHSVTQTTIVQPHETSLSYNDIVSATVTIYGGRSGHRILFVTKKGGTKNDEDISLRFGPRTTRRWFILDKQWKNLLANTITRYGKRHMGSAWATCASKSTTTGTSADCRERVMSSFGEVA